MGNTAGRIGYVENNYVLNPKNGLYTCQLNTCNIFKDDLLKRREGEAQASSSNKDLSNLLIKSPSTITQTVDLIPIDNTFNITSPNLPSQIIIMSRDNKFIFIQPPAPNDNFDNKSNIITSIYLLIYTIIKYRIPIPSLIYVMAVSFASDAEPIDDGVYSKLPDDTNTNFEIKREYKQYLTAFNPQLILLNFDSDTSKWKNISYFFLTMYQDKTGKNLIPETTCIDIRMNDPPSQLKKFDCRNVKDGTNYISPSYELSDATDFLKGNSMAMIIACVILLLCCCSSSIAAFMFMSKGSGSSHKLSVKKKGGYYYL